MEDFARGTVVGFAVSMTIPAMYYFNKAALGTLFSINKEIGKALVRLIVRPPPPEIEYVSHETHLQRRRLYNRLLLLRQRSLQLL